MSVRPPEGTFVYYRCDNFAPGPAGRNSQQCKTVALFYVHCWNVTLSWFSARCACQATRTPPSLWRAARQWPTPQRSRTPSARCGATRSRSSPTSRCGRDTPMRRARTAAGSVRADGMRPMAVGFILLALQRVHLVENPGIRHQRQRKPYLIEPYY